ncbi:MAG: phage major capsid protein, partial [Gammaproteobacteria bacterium]
QAHQSEYRPTAVLLNPADWFDIDTRKVGASDDRYVVGNPREMGQPRLWGLPVVITNSITSGTFLVGAFDIGAQIWDREDATIEVSRENSDNFVKNMVTILAEERIALTVYRPGAFIKGSL